MTSEKQSAPKDTLLISSGRVLKGSAKFLAGSFNVAHRSSEIVGSSLINTLVPTETPKEVWFYETAGMVVGGTILGAAVGATLGFALAGAAVGATLGVGRVHARFLHDHLLSSGGLRPALPSVAVVANEARQNGDLGAYAAGSTLKKAMSAGVQDAFRNGGEVVESAVQGMKSAGYVAKLAVSSLGSGARAAATAVGYTAQLATQAVTGTVRFTRGFVGLQES